MKLVLTRACIDPKDASGAFAAATDLLAGQAEAFAQAVADLTGDLVLLLDEAGVVRSVAGWPLSLGEPRAWAGQAWVDTAAPDTRAKAQHLLRELTTCGQAGRREINHPSDAGAALPLAWTGLRLGPHGPSVLLGRDLRDAAALQARFLAAQRQLEAGYWQAAGGRDAGRDAD